MTTEELNGTGEWMWVPHPTDVFAAAKLLPARTAAAARGGGSVVVELQADGTESTVPKADCVPLSKPAR